MKYKSVCTATPGQVLCATINFAGRGTIRLAEFDRSIPFAIYGPALEEIQPGDLVRWHVEPNAIKACGWKKAKQ